MNEIETNLLFFHSFSSLLSCLKQSKRSGDALDNQHSFIEKCSMKLKHKEEVPGCLRIPVEGAGYG